MASVRISGSSGEPTRSSASSMSVAEAARAQSKAVIPAELTRAWGGSRDRRPTESAKPDDFVGHQRSAPVSRRISWSWARWVALGVVLLAAVGVGAVLLTRSGSTTSAPPASQPSATSPAASPSGGQPAPPPAHVYAAGGLPFAATFASTPSVTHFRASLVGTPYTATTYSGTDDASVVSVSVFPFPLGLPSMSGQAFLRVFANHLGAGPDGSSTREGRLTTFRHLPALWLAGAAKGGTIAAFGLVVLDGHVAYELQVAGPSTSVTTTFHRVLGSFRVVDPARGIVKF